MFRNYSGCASTDYLSGTSYCLVDPDGNIPGEKLVQEVVRQYCIHSTSTIPVMADYMKSFYENCITTFDQSCADQAITDSAMPDVTTYQNCYDNYITASNSSVVRFFERNYGTNNGFQYVDFPYLWMGAT